MGLPKVFFHFCYETGITHIPSGLLIFPFNIPSYAPRITPSIAVSMTSCMFHKAGIISLFQLSYVWHDLVLHPFDGACDASNIFHNHCENYTDNEDSFNNGNKHLIHPLPEELADFTFRHLIFQFVAVFVDCLCCAGDVTTENCIERRCYFWIFLRQLHSQLV